MKWNCIKIKRREMVKNEWLWTQEGTNSHVAQQQQQMEKWAMDRYGEQHWFHSTWPLWLHFWPFSFPSSSCFCYNIYIYIYKHMNYGSANQNHILFPYTMVNVSSAFLHVTSIPTWTSFFLIIFFSLFNKGFISKHMTIHSSLLYKSMSDLT